jgi:hypothetical protein
MAAGATPSHAAARLVDGSFVPVQQPERPPFDLVADMLVLVVVARTADLRAAFPGVAFLSLLGRTPLLVWFSHIRRSCYRDAAGTVHCTDEPGVGDYVELTLVAPLWQPAVFGLALYASSQLSQRIARSYYGMPKELADGAFQATRAVITAQVGNRGFIRARPLGRGRRLRWLVARWLPAWTWPVHFPSGGQVRARIASPDLLSLATVAAGALELETAWLPGRVRPLRLGLYAAGLRMTLP